MKRFLALLLILCMLLPLAACGENPAGPAEPSVPAPAEPAPADVPLTRADLEQAVVDMAWAYAAKGTAMQYDSQELTLDILGKYFTGSYRITQDAAPEFGTDDTTICSVCSDYVQKTYYQALGERIFGDSIAWTTTCQWLDCENVAGTGEDICVLRYKSPTLYETLEYVKDGRADECGVTTKHDVDEAGLVAFFEDWETNLRPGDVLLPEGHATIYIGNGCIIDCGGSKYNMETGKDAFEDKGAIARTLYDMKTFTSAGGKYNVLPDAKTPREWFLIIRPIDMLVTDDGDGDPSNDVAREGVQIAETMQARHDNPVMDIRRSVGIGSFGTAVPGEELTYTVKITNNSTLPNYKSFLRKSGMADYAGTDYTGLTVTETVPAGTELVSAGDGKVSGSTITWTVDVPAGKTVEVSYVVKVTAQPGESIVNGGGFVENIPSNTLTNVVGVGRLDADAEASLLTFADSFRDWESVYRVKGTTDVTEFAEAVYANVIGKGLSLPDTQSLFTEIYTMHHIGPMQGAGYRFRETGEAWMYTPAESDSRIRRMCVDNYFGGKGTWFPSELERNNEFNISYVQPGDILFNLTLSPYAASEARTVTAAQAAVYLGGNRFAVCDSTGAVCIESGAAYLWQSFTCDAFFLLRPAQAEELGEPLPALTRADLEQAVVELGWDYAVKGKAIQYDSQELTADILRKYSTGSFRITSDAAPEFGTDETTIFSVCSDYTQKVFYHALNQRIYGPSLEWTTTNQWLFCENVAKSGEDICLLRYTDKKYDPAEYISLGMHGDVSDTHSCTGMEMREFLKNWKENLRPGDVILPQGHAMLYIGDGCVIDCGGSKYDMATGKDKFETSGAVGRTLYRIEDVYLGSGGYSFAADGSFQKNWFVVTRPINMLVTDDGDGDPSNDPVRAGVSLPDATRTREEYPLMDIRRSTDVGVYGTAVSGSEMTYTVQIRNVSDDSKYVAFRNVTDASYRGTDYPALTVTETVPAGTELVSVSDGGAVSGSRITWTLDGIPAGKSASVSYTVKVTAQPGETVVCGGGFVGNIPSNTLSTRVGVSAPDEAAAAALQIFGEALPDSPDALKSITLPDKNDPASFAEAVYEALLGAKLELPTVPELFAQIYTMHHIEPTPGTGIHSGTVQEAWMYTSRADVAESCPMAIRGYFGGKGTWFPSDTARMNEFSLNYLQPGDILFNLSLSPYKKDAERTVKGADVMVYLGGVSFLRCTSSGAVSLAQGTSELWKTFTCDAFFALRPAQGQTLATAPTALAEQAKKEVASHVVNVFYSLLNDRTDSEAVVTRGKGWENIPVAPVITLDGVVGLQLSDASLGRQYEITLRDGVIVEMKGLIGSQNITSLVSNASNGTYTIRNIRKNADGSLSFDLKNTTKGNVDGLTLPAGQPVTDLSGYVCEPAEGDRVSSAVDRSDPTTALILRVVS